MIDELLKVQFHHMQARGRLAVLYMLGDGVYLGRILHAYASILDSLLFIWDSAVRHDDGRACDRLFAAMACLYSDILFQYKKCHRLQNKVIREHLEPFYKVKDLASVVVLHKTDQLFPGTQLYHYVDAFGADKRLDTNPGAFTAELRAMYGETCDWMTELLGQFVQQTAHGQCTVNGVDGYSARQYYFLMNDPDGDHLFDLADPIARHHGATLPTDIQVMLFNTRSRYRTVRGMQAHRPTSNCTADSCTNKAVEELNIIQPNQPLHCAFYNAFMKESDSISSVDMFSSLRVLGEAEGDQAGDGGVSTYTPHASDNPATNNEGPENEDEFQDAAWNNFISTHRFISSDGRPNAIAANAAYAMFYLITEHVFLEPGRIREELPAAYTRLHVYNVLRYQVLMNLLMTYSPNRWTGPERPGAQGPLWYQHIIRIFNAALMIRVTLYSRDYRDALLMSRRLADIAGRAKQDMYAGPLQVGVLQRVYEVSQKQRLFRYINVCETYDQLQNPEAPKTAKTSTYGYYKKLLLQRYHPVQLYDVTV